VRAELDLAIQRGFPGAFTSAIEFTGGQAEPLSLRKSPQGATTGSTVADGS